MCCAAIYCSSYSTLIVIFSSLSVCLLLNCSIYLEPCCGAIGKELLPCLSASTIHFSSVLAVYVILLFDVTTC